MVSEPVFIAPVTHQIQDRHQRFSALRKAVLHFGRDLGIFFPMDEPVCFKLFQRGAQGLVGDIADIFFHLVKPDDPEFH